MKKSKWHLFISDGNGRFKILLAKLKVLNALVDSAEARLLYGEVKL